jgi:hypothetical protein
MVELMHQGSAVHARPEHRDDIGITDFGEFMTLLGEMSDVVPQGFTLLLPAALQIPGVTRPHIRALKVAGEDLLEILQTINQFSGKVIELSSGRVSQVNGEELDDEKVVILPACPAREAVVLQPNTGIGFAIVLDNVIGHSKTLRETRVAHVAPERPGPWPLSTKVVPFSITMPTVTRIACVVLGVCPCAPYEPNDASGARGKHSGGLVRDKMGPVLMKTQFLPWGVPSWSFIGWP